MIPAIYINPNRAVICLVLWSFIFSALAVFLINNNFVPKKYSFSINKDKPTQLTLKLEKTATIVLKVKVPYDIPENDLIHNSLSIIINGREINANHIKKYYTRHQTNFIVPGSYFGSADENRIIVKLPPSSPRDNPFVAPYLKIYNYKYISPNIPVAYVVFDQTGDSSMPSETSWKIKIFSNVFLIVFGCFLIYLTIIKKAFFKNTSEFIPAGIRFLSFITLILILIYAYNWITPYRIIFPEETLFWLITIAFLVFIFIGVFIFGALFPQVNRFLVPNNTQGEMFSRRIFENIHATIILYIERNYDIRNFKLLLASLASIPFILYCIHIFQNSINFPVHDDLIALSYLNGFAQSDQIFEILQLTFARHNEHRPAFYRFVLGANYFLTGEVDFKDIAILGNSAVIILLVLFYKISPPIRYKAIYFLPVIPFFLSLNGWVAITKPIHLLSNYFVHCFAGLSIYFLVRPTPIRFILSMILASMATYSQGGGMLVFAVGIVFLTATRDYKRGVAWFIFASLNILLYFQDFSFSAPGTWQIKIDLTPLNFSLFFLSFIGASFSFGKVFFAVPVGVGCLLFVLYLTQKKYFQQNPINYFFIMYMILIGLAVAYGRTQLGIDSSLSSRYQLNSSILAVLLYIAFQDLFFKVHPGRLILVAYLTLSSFLYNFYSLNEFSHRMRNETKGIYEQMRTSFQSDFPEKDSSNMELKDIHSLYVLRNKQYYSPCEPVNTKLCK